MATEHQLEEEVGTDRRIVQRGFGVRQANRLQRGRREGAEDAGDDRSSRRPGYIRLKPTSQYMMAAREKSAMFLVSCMVTFLERTRPASSMAKPAAIQNTRKPPTRNSRRGQDILGMLGSQAASASCAKRKAVGSAVSARAARGSFTLSIIIGPSVLAALQRVFQAGFAGAHPQGLLHVQHERSCRHRSCRCGPCLVMVSTTWSACSAGTTISSFILGTKFTSYSAPR